MLLLRYYVATMKLCYYVEVSSTFDFLKNNHISAFENLVYILFIFNNLNNLTNSQRFSYPCFCRGSQGAGVAGGLSCQTYKASG